MMRPFIVMPAAALEAMDMPEMWRPFFIEEGQDQGMASSNLRMVLYACP